MSPITVRLACAADIPDLSRLWHENITLRQQTDPRIQLRPGALDDWAGQAHRWLADANFAIYVAECASQTLGYMVGQVQPAPPGLWPDRLGVVLDVTVDPHSHQGGVGRRLFDALAAWFMTQDIRQVLAHVPRRQPVEQAFWRARGASDWMEVLWLTL